MADVKGLAMNGAKAAVLSEWDIFDLEEWQTHTKDRLSAKRCCSTPGRLGEGLIGLRRTAAS